MKSIHGVRDHFRLEDYLKARKHTLKALGSITSKLEIGMSESDGIALVDGTLKELGVSKKWHPTKFRIGENTLCSFSEKSQASSTLSPGEIFFLDIGPVWDGYEGDIGRTYIYNDHQSGSHLIDLQMAAQKVFKATEKVWQQQQLTGAELYQYASIQARELGFELNLKMAGHRLGDFPHHLFYRGAMLDIEESPVDNLWVLEILIKDPKTQRGAFYEDILSSI